MLNINGDHLVAIVLDFKQSLVWYGDLFSSMPVKQVISVINWWTFHHTGRKFAYYTMRMQAQKDGFLCGLLGTNSLEHFYMPEKYLLINVANVNTEHVQMFLRVVQQHLDQSEVCIQHYIQQQFTTINFDRAWQ